MPIGTSPGEAARDPTDERRLRLFAACALSAIVALAVYVRVSDPWKPYRYPVPRGGDLNAIARAGGSASPGNLDDVFGELSDIDRSIAANGGIGELEQHLRRDELCAFLGGSGVLAAERIRASLDGQGEISTHSALLCMWWWWSGHRKVSDLDRIRPETMTPSELSLVRSFAGRIRTEGLTEAEAARVSELMSIGAPEAAPPPAPSGPPAGTPAPESR